MNQGMVYVFTGDGKGKTSAALGTAIRAVGAGKKVGWVAWYKQSSWKMSEITSLEKLGVGVFLMGKGFHISDKGLGIGQQDKRIKSARVGGKGNVVVDTAEELEHKQAAQEALKKAMSLLSGVDVLVLDEVNNAVKDKLINSVDLIDLISKRGKAHLILTGRNAAKEIVKSADLVTEMKKVKHPYDKGKLAMRGLDF